MDFNRKELIGRLRRIKQARAARVRQRNKEVVGQYESYSQTWFASHEADLRALRDALTECLEQRKPLALDVLPAAFKGGYFSAVKTNNPPAMQELDTTDLDTAIDILSTVTGDTISANDLAKAGIRLQRWMS